MSKITSSDAPVSVAEPTVGAPDVNTQPSEPSSWKTAVQSREPPVFSGNVSAPGVLESERQAVGTLASIEHASAGTGPTAGSKMTLVLDLWARSDQDQADDSEARSIAEVQTRQPTQTDGSPPLADLYTKTRTQGGVISVETVCLLEDRYETYLRSGPVEGKLKACSPDGSVKLFAVVSGIGTLEASIKARDMPLGRLPLEDNFKLIQDAASSAFTTALESPQLSQKGPLVHHPKSLPDSERKDAAGYITLRLDLGECCTHRADEHGNWTVEHSLELKLEPTNN